MPLRDLSDAARRANRDTPALRAEYGRRDEVGILKSRLAHLDYKASHDELTGVLNRSGYELLLSGIDFDSTCMILFDVDNFKNINDTFGHEVGDRVLERLARILKKQFRSEDYVCRIGGDEFVVFMVSLWRRANSYLLSVLPEAVNQRFFILSEA